jgi:anti-sigma regulatory factor (Ser/Thr protein kinase)
MPGDALHWSQVTTFGADARNVARARDTVVRRLEAEGLSTLADEVVLVVSELATNALRHGGGDFELELSRDGSEVAVRVRDHAVGTPVGASPASLDESGRGLLIVEASARDWGATLRGDGSKSVWAAFDVPAGVTGASAAP